MNGFMYTVMLVLFVLFMFFIFGGYHKNKSQQREAQENRKKDLQTKQKGSEKL